MNYNHPPNWLTKLLTWGCRKDLLESLEGDLYELFQDEAEHKGLKRARANYFFNVIRLLLHQRLRRRQNSKTQNTMSLLSNYVKVSVRDLTRHMTFSFINLFGLTVGFLSLILILQYVLFEVNYDKKVEDYDSIYRVINDRYQNGVRVQKGAITYPVIGPYLMEEYPEVTSYTRLTVGGRNYVSYKNELHLLEDYLWVDQYFIDFFNVEILEGDPKGLKDPGNVMFTESYSKRYLEKGENPGDIIGKMIRINDWDIPCKVVAVVKDSPANSHLDYSALISYSTFISLAGEGANNSTEWSDFYHYIKLLPGTDQAYFESKLIEFGKKHFKDGEVSGAEERFQLQTLSEVHLDNTLEYEYANVVDGEFVWLLLIVSFIIIAIAWINYINLTTSRSLQRSKEVSVRKVMGAHKKQLTGQFVFESLFINCLSLFFAVALVLIFQPYFNDFISQSLGFYVFIENSFLGIPWLIWLLSGFILVVLLVGLYPAIITSRFSILGGNGSGNKNQITLRRFLVVSQFIIALVMITGTLTIYRQVNFMKSQDLGIDIENNLVVYGPDLTQFDSAYIPKFREFKSELSRNSSIKSVTAMGRLFGDKMPRVFMLNSSADPDRNDLGSNWLSIDYDFIDQFGLDVISGRSFTKGDYHVDGDKVRTAILNKSAVEALKFSSPQDALEGSFTIGYMDRTYKIVGVVDNFHQSSLKQSIEPIIFFPFYDNNQYFVIRYAEGDEEKVIAKTRDLFRSFYPGNYFDYFFLEDHFNRQYRDDEKMGKASTLFTILAIIMAVSGLYGLMLITLLRKTKEIGIRKVLGASGFQLFGYFGRQFVFPVAIAIVMGIPMSKYVLGLLMDNYAYQPGYQIGIYIISTAILLSISLATLMFQISRISKNDPVSSLRYE